MLKAANNATYISKLIQNELIGASGEVIVETIIQRLSDVKYFYTIADETTGRGRLEQMTLIVRYCYNGSVREDFVSFLHALDLTGARLANAIYQS